MITNEEAMRKMVVMAQEIAILDRLGGRDSFFGMQRIFETILKEEHEKDSDEPKEGMYRFHGMEQYGNIVSVKCAKKAVERCIDELKFTKEEFSRLLNWYQDRSIDCKVLYLTIKFTLEERKW